VEHIHLDNQPEVVRQFVLNLPVSPDGTVLELSGRPVACVLPPPKLSKAEPTTQDEWSDAKNVRRCELIDRKYAGTLTPQEAIELAGLQEEMIRYRDSVAPLPLEDARRLHQELLMKAQKQSRKSG